MVQLVSGKVLKTPSANVSAERYQFIEISEAEPDLGVPPANNYVFTSDPEGNRQWVDATTYLANTSVAFGNIYAADTLFGNNLIVRNIDILDALIGDTTLANVILTREVYVANIISDRITANAWEGIYTANVTESPENLYYSNDRVIANLNLASIDIFRDVVDLSNIDFGQGLIWDGNAFAPVYISSDLANIADLAIRVTSIENFTTANVREASSNLYFTNTRVLDALVEANVIVNDLFVSGDLIVQGNSAILNVATLIVEDKNIVLANGATSAAIADGAGITIQGADANITYREAGDKIEINKNLDVQGNIIAGSGTGGSIIGANVITTEALAADLLVTDTIVSNTILNTASITAETIFSNVVANTIRTDSVNTSTVISDSDLVLVAGAEVITFNSSGDLKLPNYVEFEANSYIGDEPAAGIPQLRIVAAAGKGLSFENDADISGNNNVATFDISGEFAVPKSLHANSLVSNLLSITGIAQVNGFDVITKELTDATFEPMGHEDKANSTISFDANTRTFSIAPVDSSYTVWVKGNKFVKTGTESVTLANTTDLYYIYFNTDGNIAVRSSYFDWENDAVTSYVYFNANTQSAVFFADERHGIALDWATHEYLHRTRGAVIAEGFSLSGYTLNNDGSSDANAQISIGNGTFFDEDLEVNIVHSNTPAPNTWEQDLQGPARIPMFYLSGTEWVRDDPTDFPLKQGTARIKYNQLSGDQWTVPDVPNEGYFTTSWIIATNNLNYPILAIMGQSASETIGQEEAKTFQDLTLTNFPVIEFRPLYKIIWSTNTGYVNTPKAIISRIYDLRNIISASPSAAIASDHGLLSGLGDDDHDQYVHTEIARVISADHTFTGDITFANVSAGFISGNFTGTANFVSSLDNFTTDNLNEGTSNLYYSDTRVVNAVSPLLTSANVVELGNLYYTNERVFANVSEMSVNVLSDVDITDISIGEILVWDGTKFIPGTSDIALFSETANSALIANTVVSLNDFTTDNLNEGSANLYFTPKRAVESFSAGRGIIITEAGTISSIDDSELYNTSIDNSIYSIVTSDGKNIISTNSSPSDASYLVHSLQITNIADNTVYVSGNIQYASGHNVDLLNRIRMPIGSSLEILEKSLVLLPGDKINLVTSNGNVSVVGSYESVYNDETFINPSLSISTANSDSLLHNSNVSYTILETIKISNLDNKDIPVKIKVTDANNDPKGYLVYNLKIPQNSIVDILQKPKRLEIGDKLFASYTNSANSNAVSVFVSGRLGAISAPEIVPASIDGNPGNTIVGFATTEPEGSTLYYTFTEV